MNKQIQDIDLFIMDLDGTIYLGNKIIDGSLDFVNILKKENKKFCFFTNNDSKASTEFMKKLFDMGFSFTEENFYTAGLATIDYLNDKFLGKSVYLLGTESLKNEFRKHNINLVDTDPDIVVVAYDTELTYQKLDRACHYIRNGAYYIATHPDYNCPTNYGYAPDTGSYIALIKQSTNRMPDLLNGKPNKELGEIICKRFNKESHKVAMIGDRLMTDMRLAINCGFKSILVLSGESTMEDYKQSGIGVDIVVNSVKDLL
ncbi:MAG: HAD-IIA family hydrolase [Clostridia bacterium]|nr:HAD-IIA family hydrolase [Clostridia bacterium]